MWWLRATSGAKAPLRDKRRRSKTVIKSSISKGLAIWQRNCKEKGRKQSAMKWIQTLTITMAASLMPLAGQPNDDQAHGVARVSVLAGEVSIQRGDSGDRLTATLNAPLVTQDRLITGPGARAELQFDFANMVRLGANTEIRLAELQYQRYQVNIPVGLVTFRVWQNSESEVDLNTPVASIRPMRRGEYRIQVLEDGSTEVTVREGEVDIFTPEGSRRLGNGRSLTIRKEVNGQTSFLSGAPAPVDSWDQWNRSRDRELAASRSRQYLPPGVYGAEQLDAYGDWIYAPPYGNVWRPRVAVGWAPYRLGRWTWLDWYGWTWVSYDPWGWAPYHYGRWFWHANSWCWWPGAVGVRYFWSPALVSFVGFGRGFGVSVGFGWSNVGWVPLAPFETFHPWWGRGYYGGRNFNHVTVVNNVNITNIYRNARVDGGVSYVEATNFNRGTAYEGGGVRAARANDLANVSEFRGPVGIAPTRESVRYAANDTGVRGGNLVSTGREDMRFTARREAAAIERIPFEQQRQNIEQVARGWMDPDVSGVRGGSQGFRRVGGERSSGEGFVQRGMEGARGGGYVPSEGFRRIGGDRGAERGGEGVSAWGSEGFVRRSPEGVRGGSRTERSGWQGFGEARGTDSFEGVRGGGGRGNEGFVQRDRSDAFGGSRSRGVGAVDVSPRIVEPSRGRMGGDYGGGSRSGSIDAYGGGWMQQERGSGSGARGGSGWSGFGGIRGGGMSNGSTDSYGSGRMGRDSGSGGGSRGGWSAPGSIGGFGGVRGDYPSGGGMSGGGGRMSMPSGGGGRMSMPSGGGSMGGVRGGGMGAGGAAPASRGGSAGGGGGGRRGGNQ
jgi:hypothetical protein